MTRPWTRDETSASGQVFEFRLWALITEQSRGQLHVFLPVADKGVDALAHRLTDGTYLPVQAKSRSMLTDGEVHLVVPAQSIEHDDILIVGGLIEAGGLGPTVLVIPAADFRRLADLTSDKGRPIYSMEFGMRPRSDSRWFPWLVPTERLAERFGATIERGEVVGAELPPDWRSSFGFLGESEVMRRLAEADDLNLFRAFPDSETAEIAALHLGTRAVIGLQVKIVDIDQTRLRGTVNVLASSFRPSATTYFVVLAWLRDEAAFHEEFLLIPSVELRDFVRDDGYGHLTFEFLPGSSIPGRLDSYRRNLVRLKAAIERLLI